MLKVALNTCEDQARRLQIKTIGQQMKMLAVEGAGMAPWSAEVLVNMIDEVYFSGPDLRDAVEGQLKYRCISTEDGAGKPLDKCQLVTVLLTLFDKEDEENLAPRNRSTEIRRRRLLRITEEAKEQGGLLSQEDLKKVLMCDVRTIRRDIADLRISGIVVATRGQQKDIGPGVTHRGQAIKWWLEGKEPFEVARQIKHSVAAVENYLEKFKRVSYLCRKGFKLHETALTVGISTAAAKTFMDIYYEFKGKSFFQQRMAEINLEGSQFYFATGEKKELATLSNAGKGWRLK